MCFYHLTLVSIAQFLFLFSFFDWRLSPTFLSLMLWYLLIYTLFIDVLEWAHTSGWKSTAHTSVQLLVQWLHAGSLKLAMAGVFTSQKLANATNQGVIFREKNCCTLTSSPLFLLVVMILKNTIFYRFLTKSKIKYLEFLLNNTKF